MKQRFPIAVKLICGLALTFCATAQAVGVGEVAPMLFASRQQGSGTLDSTTLQGKVVYIDFWASWCAPCRQAMPVLDALYQRYRDRGLVVLGVNVDTDPATGRKTWRHAAVQYPSLFDPHGDWAQAFGLEGMPAGYLVDRNGVVRFTMTGFQASDGTRVEQAVRNLMEDQRQ